MMNFYPFFGPPFYRRPSHYYSGNNYAYNAKRETAHNSGCAPTYNPGHNVNYNSTYRSNNNLHNYSNVPNKNTETHYSPSITRSQNNRDNNNNNNNNSNSLPSIDSCFEDNYFSDEYFEIFGLKLHFDDILIICILFFLYQEDVKDTYLYISLILLLLS